MSAVPTPPPPTWLQVTRVILGLQGLVALAVGLVWSAMLGLAAGSDPALLGDPSLGVTVGAAGLGLSVLGLAVPAGLAFALGGGWVEARLTATLVLAAGLFGPWLPFAAVGLYGLWIDEDVARFFAFVAEERAAKLTAKRATPPAATEAPPASG